MKPRTISANGLELVKHFEGLYLKAYKCPAGVWTIGYGHTGIRHNDGTVYPGRTITEATAEALLAEDLQKFADRVSSLVKVTLNQDQFDALVSFDYNTGGLAKSTLLKRLNAGAYREVPHQLLRWTRANGKVLRGLVRRRQSESLLFQSIRPFIVPA